MLRTKLDNAICALWRAYFDYSTVLIKSGKLSLLTSSDLDLWGKVTAHNAVQSRLDFMSKGKNDETQT